MKDIKLVEIFLLCFLIIMSGCKETKESKDHYIGVEAVADNTGDISVGEINPSEMSREVLLLKELNEIEKKFPGKFPSSNYESSLAKEITEAGDILLEDGSTLHLLGLKCNERFLKSLRFQLLTDKKKIAYENKSSENKYLNIERLWIVEQVPVEGVGLMFEPVYEGGLLNGECMLVTSEKNRFSERYAQIALLSKE